MTRTASAARRPGFTLVELMVAAALCLAIMAILANCFQTSIDTMRHLRSSAEMADQLRAASNVLRRDLAAEHFVPQSGKPRQGVNVSDQLYDTVAAGAWPAPLGGFFRVRTTAAQQDSAVGDGYSISSSYRDGEPNLGHLLHFTSILSGRSDQDYYYASVTDPTVSPAVTRQFTSRAAEIAYFLNPSWSSTVGTPPNERRTYQLIRRQRLVAMGGAEQTQLASLAAPALLTAATPMISLPYPGSGGTTVNSLTDLVTPQRRLGGPTPANVPKSPPTPAGDADLCTISGDANRIGDDILLSNVLSFEVKLSWISPGGTADPRAFNPPGNNTDYPFDTLGGATNGAVVEFDTGNNPPTIRVRAIQVRIRIWDPKLQSARQASIVLPL